MDVFMVGIGLAFFALTAARFFAGLTVEEIAHVLGRSPRTVKREWQLAKAWLFRGGARSSVPVGRGALMLKETAKVTS